WPYVRNWTDYNARLSSVFQASKPVVDVAILCPSAGMWSRSSLDSYQATTPWYANTLWQAISHHGLSADYLTERDFQQAKFDGGKLRVGAMTYGALIVVDAEILAPATAASLVLMAEQGGRIVFVGK